MTSPALLDSRDSAANMIAPNMTGPLRHVGAELRNLAASTEQDFLAVGGNLESIVVRARQKAEALTGLLTDDGEHGQALATALADVTSWAAGTGQAMGSSQSLATLLKIVRSVTAPLRSLKNAVQILRAMGIAMRVESARLGSQASDFEALGREVGALAIGVDKKADAILDTIDGLVRLLVRTQATAVKLGREQQEKLVRLTEECTAGLDDLRAEHTAIADASRNAQAGFQRVVSGIGHLVVNLQFHDSTRQRIEHIDEALAALADSLDVPAASDRSLDGTTAVRILELQAAQLSDAGNSFQGAVGQVRSDLQQIGDAAASFAQTARELAGQGAGESGEFAVTVEDRFSKVGQAVAEWSASRRALGEAAHQADQACSRMSLLVSEVESVGRHMFRLALNAEIQAFQMSSSGEVMVAVADTIRGVSRDASANAATVSQSLREVQRSAEGLSAVLGGDLTAQSQQAAEMAARVRESAGELRARNAASRRALRSIADDGDALAREIAELREGITADRVMAQVSAVCLESLEEVAAIARTVAGDPDAQQHAEILHQALRSYTMRAEREVHDALAGVPGGSGVALQPVAAMAGSGSELGDNVELF
jgi:hypothetical protein